MNLSYILNKKTITTFVLSCVNSIFLSHKIAGNENLLMILTTLFSIFCGFIFLILPIIGQLSLPSPHASDDANYINEFNHLVDFGFYKILFYSYLINIIMIFVFFLEYDFLNTALQYIITFWSTSLLIVSFSLPNKLAELTQQAIERRKQEF